ncbi:MAG: decarboxylase [Bacteroidetes bacterium]|nr:MAG: decarboxylase [Bacteroidota bacterium]
MKYIFLALSIVMLHSCGSIRFQGEPFTVGYNGALKQIMHQGDISAKANLQDFNYTKNLYALGAVENLKGEIQIFDGKPFISVGLEEMVLIKNTFDLNATLFVYTTVKKWHSFEVPDNISSYEDFEQYVEETAKTYGIDTDKPFPFLLEGNANSIDWHVINWKDGDTEHSHHKHITSGPHGTLTETIVEILGFYSKSHHAIFTHHTTNMHMHFKTADETLAGHLDGLTLGKGMTLKLPFVK